MDNPRPLASYIDHTLLKAEATTAQIEELCREAFAYKFRSVCVNPVYVEGAAAKLKALKGQAEEAADDNDAPVVCTVIGFPLGSNTTDTKVREAQEAIELGAREIDMVIAVGKLKGGEFAYVLDDIRSVVAVCHAHGVLCKVIIETCLLEEQEKVKACEICVEAGADFVKTSTGFGGGGATEEDVQLMAMHVVDKGLQVKASGGIRSEADARRMIAAGATRLGTSAGTKICAGAAGQPRAPSTATTAAPAPTQESY